MKLIEQQYKVWGECPTEKEATLEWIEQAGKVCTDKRGNIAPGTARPFFDSCMKKGHGAIAEMSNIVFKATSKSLSRHQTRRMLEANYHSKYLTTYQDKTGLYIGGNLRAWLEACPGKTIDDFYGPEPPPGLVRLTDLSEIPWNRKQVTCSFITDRAVSHELVRHRPCSFLQESQRYVAYQDEITYIKPSWWAKADSAERWNFITACETAGDYYYLLRKQLPPEHARVVLNNQTATEIIVTADLPEWNLIFGLRTTMAAYPQMRKLMTPVRQEFEKRGWTE